MMAPGLEYDPTRAWRKTSGLAQTRRQKSIAAVDPPSVLGKFTSNVMGVPASILSHEEIAITSSEPKLLLKDLTTGTLSSEHVTKAFLRRAAVAQGLTNCITDLLPERAIARAQELDSYLKKYGQPIGPLHGLPISVKEHIGMKGLDVNMGLCTFYGSIVDEDAPILKILYNAGAVFHARTMEPQFLMHLETDNNLYGVTNNPYSPLLTSGGSSGGEAALIALGGSLLGIGTDIGGSIRNPAANCGIFGFKPTVGRLPMLGVEDGAEGLDQILTAIGPMSSSLILIHLFLKTIVDARPWLLDVSCAPLPWRMNQQLLPPKLKVAVMLDDGIVMPHPPIRRAIKEAMAQLRCAGDIEVVMWKPCKHDEGWKIISTLYFSDGADDEKAALEATGEPWLPLSRFIITDNPNYKDGGLDKHENRALVARRDQYRQEHAEHWNATATQYDQNGSPLDAVDVILCPAGPGTAPQHNCSRYWSYTSQWNLLDYPAFVFPYMKVDPAVDHKDASYEPRNADDKYNHDLYDPDLYNGLPVSLQLVGRRFEDEKVLQAFDRIRPSLGVPKDVAH